jgi:hypothetical protein
VGSGGFVGPAGETGELTGRAVGVGKIKAGLAASGVVVVVTEWLMLSHSVSWLVSGVLPH